MAVYGSPWWNMFADYGSVELYLLCKVMEKQEKENVGAKNSGTDIDRSQFK